MVDRLVLEHRVVDARDLLDVQAARVLPVRLVARVLIRVARRQRLQVEAVVRVRRVFQAGVAELVEQEGDALVAVAAVRVAAVGQKTDQRLVELHPLRRLRAVGRHRALDALDADGARAVAGQQQADQGLEGEQVLGLRPPGRAAPDTRPRSASGGPGSPHSECRRSDRPRAGRPRPKRPAACRTGASTRAGSRP